MQKDKIIIHSDGGARGNPGPGACAFVVEEGEEVLYKGSKYLGKVTNNIAEYSGVLEALNWLYTNKEILSNDFGPVEFYMDSELVVRQINGQYKVKDENLRKIFLELKGLLDQLPVKVLFINIPRNKNKTADFLVNEKLDASV